MRPMLAVCATLLVAACSGAQAPTVAVVGKPAPAFSERTISGGTLDMASLRGHAVYLNFFASWCGPCNDEASDIEAISQADNSDGVRVVGIDVLESAARAKAFVAAHHLTYPAVIDDGTLRDAYNINGMPVHAFIDRSGILRKIVTGQMNRAQIESAIASVNR